MRGAIQCTQRMIIMDEFEEFGCKINDNLAIGVEEDCIALTIRTSHDEVRHHRVPWDQVLYRLLVSDASKIWLDSEYQQRVDFLNQIGASFCGQTKLGPAYTLYPCVNPRI